MTRWAYQKGLQEIGTGCFAYLQPDGAWGWSNAGLVTDGDASLLVDTLFDLRLTGEMLDEMRRATSAAARIDQVVNTHANGDHCFGNQLVEEAEIIASTRCAQELRELPPKKVALLLRVARILKALGRPGRVVTSGLGRLGLGKARDLGDAAEFVLDIFGAFEFRGIRLVLPTRTFDGELELNVGGKRVLLLEVGPAHTLGDVLVHVPEDRTVFTGDILFAESHPILWAGPVSNWRRACERIQKMDVETVVPGHGPITDKAGVRRLGEYLSYLESEVRDRYDAGMSAEEAARDISFESFAGWTEAERVLVNVDTLYRELSGVTSAPDAVESFARMARFRAGK